MSSTEIFTRLACLCIDNQSWGMSLRLVDWLFETFCYQGSSLVRSKEIAILTSWFSPTDIALTTLVTEHHPQIHASIWSSFWRKLQLFNICLFADGFKGFRWPYAVVLQYLSFKRPKKNTWISIKRGSHHTKLKLTMELNFQLTFYVFLFWAPYMIGPCI